MAGFFKNRRVYLLTSIAYLGSLLFGEASRTREDGPSGGTDKSQAMTRV